MKSRRTALLIGNENFLPEAGLTRLFGPPNDVALLAQLLGDSRRGAFDVIALIDAKSYAVLQELERIAARSEPDDCILVYYSGHGRLSLRGELCLATSDTAPGMLHSTAIPLARATTILVEARAQSSVLVLDCCYSGAAGKSYSGLRGMVEDQLAVRVTSGLHVLTSSSAVESASEREGGEDGGILGAFTQAIGEGLSSGAADLDGDGLISPVDLSRYASRRTKGQTPHYWGFETAGEVVIANAMSSQDLSEEIQRGCWTLRELYVGNELPRPEYWAGLRLLTAEDGNHSGAILRMLQSTSDVKAIRKQMVQLADVRTPGVVRPSLRLRTTVLDLRTRLSRAVVLGLITGGTLLLYDRWEAGRPGQPVVYELMTPERFEGAIEPSTLLPPIVIAIGYLVGSELYRGYVKPRGAAHIVGGIFGAFAGVVTAFAAANLLAKREPTVQDYLPYLITLVASAALCALRSSAVPPVPGARVLGGILLGIVGGWLASHVGGLDIGRGVLMGGTFAGLIAATESLEGVGVSGVRRGASTMLRVLGYGSAAGIATVVYLNQTDSNFDGAVVLPLLTLWGLFLAVAASATDSWWRFLRAPSFGLFGVVVGNVLGFGLLTFVNRRTYSAETILQSSASWAGAYAASGLYAFVLLLIGRWKRVAMYLILAGVAVALSARGRLDTVACVVALVLYFDTDEVGARARPRSTANMHAMNSRSVARNDCVKGL